MRYLLHGCVIEGTVLKRYQSDHKKCVHVKEIGAYMAVSLNHQIIVCVITVVFFFLSLFLVLFSSLLTTRHGYKEQEQDATFYLTINHQFAKFWKQKLRKTLLLFAFPVQLPRFLQKKLTGTPPPKNRI